MNIVILVTRHALVLRIVISLGRMALVAGGYDVLPKQRIVAQVVVEADILAPPVSRMTLAAIFTELTHMNIADPVTADALLAQFLF